MDLDVSPLTNGIYTPISAVPYNEDSNGLQRGIEVTWGSDVTCATGGTNTFTSKVACHHDIDEQGDALITSVDKSDPCNVIVNLQHDAGCPIRTANDLTIWLNNNPWFLAIVLIIIGFICSFFGLQ